MQDSKVIRDAFSYALDEQKLVKKHLTKEAFLKFDYFHEFLLDVSTQIIKYKFKLTDKKTIFGFFLENIRKINQPERDRLYSLRDNGELDELADALSRNYAEKEFLSLTEVDSYINRTWFWKGLNKRLYDFADDNANMFRAGQPLDKEKIFTSFKNHMLWKHNKMLEA